jgi:hypothetical protein
MNWTKGIERVPLYRLIFATACGWGLTIGIPIWLAATPNFDAQRRLSIEGEILDVQTPLVGEEKVLDFALRDQTMRFRVQPGIFSAGLSRRVPSDFRPGAIATIRVTDDNYRAPSLLLPGRSPTISVDAIQVGQHTILSLDISRRWHEENRQWAWYLLAFFIPATVLLSFGTRVRLRWIRDERNNRSQSLEPQY